MSYNKSINRSSRNAVKENGINKNSAVAYEKTCCQTSQTAIKKDKSEKPVLILTGGGTGGHIYPNLALLPALESRGFEVAYVGGEGDTLEHRLAVSNAIPYYGVPVIKLVRSISPKALSNNVKIPLKLHKAVKASEKLLEKLKPSAVFSKGGFVSLPVVLAARKADIPVFCHESDYTLGLANKIAAKKGAYMMKANPYADFDGTFVGMPIRENLFKAERDRARKKLNVPKDKKCLLIVGGSSGASAINEAVYKNLDELTENFYIVHVSGKNKGGEQIRKDNYLQIEYAENIADYYAACDIAVSRAGATAVFEISALNLRALFIPLPKGVSRGDQIYNAELAQKYGASVLKQDENMEKEFVNAIKSAAKKKPMRSITNDANGKITEIICASLNRGRLCTIKKQ